MKDATCDNARFAQLGFPEFTSVSTYHSIAHLIPNKSKRCGIYVLQLPEGRYYIGQSVDVVRRFTGHRKAGHDILGISFIRTSKSELDSVEQEKIMQAESLGLLLTNSTHVRHIVGDADLDDLVPVEEQAIWLDTPHNLALVDDNHKKIALGAGHLAAFEAKYKALRHSVYYNRVTSLLERYVASCILSPILTEYAFWSVSCLPSTNRNTRLSAVNAGMMELFVLGYYPEQPEKIWAFINVSQCVLQEDTGLISVLLDHGIEIRNPMYRDAAGDCASLDFISPDDDWLLRDSSIRKAAAALSLRIMRKRPTIYSKYHCKQLADDVLLAISRSD